MAVYNIVKLTNLSPLHIGTGRDNYDSAASELQSDTLSSALAAMRALRGKTDDLYEFISSFTISSAFPFYKDKYFLPKPQGRINVEIAGKSEHEYRKKLKKVKYVDTELYDKVLASEKIVVDSSQVNGDFITSTPDAGKISINKTQVSERVTVFRGEEDAVPFFFDWHYYDHDAGLYCIVKSSEELFLEIKDLFQQLGTYGIGTDKNVGGGKFDVEVDTLTINEPETYNSQILLSLYIPTAEEHETMDLSNSKYTILQRGGFMAGSNIERFMHIRKESIYAYGVGSMLSTDKELNGKVVDLRPDWNDSYMHPVYRSGKPFVLPFYSV